MQRDRHGRHQRFFRQLVLGQVVPAICAAIPAITTSLTVVSRIRAASREDRVEVVAARVKVAAAVRMRVEPAVWYIH